LKTCRYIQYRRVPLSAFFVLLTAVSFGQMQFVENKGQWQKEVDYKSNISNGTFFLQQQGFTVLLQHEKDRELFFEQMHGHSHDPKNTTAKAIAPQPLSSPVTIRQHAYRVSFAGASGLVKAMPDKMLPTYNNYFIGTDPAKWQAECRLYQAVTYSDMYPNIDVRYYTDQGTLKYDIIVHPGASPDDIALKYEGVDKLSIKNKELIIGTSVGDVKELYPYTYQVTKEGRKTLDCRYVLDEKTRTVRFKVSDYDPTATIVIDPTLIFCSFTGSTSDNWGYTATPGPDGSMYTGGIVFENGFPVSPGAFDVTYNGGSTADRDGPYDMAIMKLSPNGRNRMYATYIGGSGNEQPHSIICDAQGNLVIAGRTNSPVAAGTGYPITSPPVGPGGGYDIIVTKLNATGTALLGSLRMGGNKDDGVNIKAKYAPLGVPGQAEGAYDIRRNYGDDARSEVIVDANNNIYLASCTQSDNFPVSGAAVQSTFGGGGQHIKQDGIIAKFPPDLSSVSFSTYFGGAGNDACFVLAISPTDGTLYVGGATTAADLPGSKAGVIYPTYQGGAADGFVSQMAADGSAVLRTTYIGTNDNSSSTDGIDLVYGLQFDKFGYPYIMGTTTGNWQKQNATFGNAGGKQFIAKLEKDLSAYVYTTMFGTNSPSPNISPVAFLVDRCQNVYVSGWGGVLQNNKLYPNSGTNGLDFLITAGAIQTRTDGSDFFFFVLEKDARSQLYGTYFGQIGGFTDHVDGGTSRFDANGIIYQSMCANCADANAAGVFYPVTPNVWGPRNNSSSCNNAMVKIEMNFGGVGANIRTIINGIPNSVSGCDPLRVEAFDSLSKAQRFFWNWGDGSKIDTLFNSSDTGHVYNLPAGVLEQYYTIMLIAEDSTTCNVRDTAFKRIRVSSNFAQLSFRFQKQPPCTNLTYQFTNTSVVVNPSSNPKGFLWDFGDGTTDTGSISYPPTHTYASPGRYIVRLCVIDTFFCNSPDCFVDTINISAITEAIFATPLTGCVPYTAVFKNNSLGGQQWIWDFGDGTSSGDFEPANKVYDRTGTFTVRLTVIDSSTCNITDDTALTITVLPNPIAAGYANPVIGEENKPINFFNTSTGAVRYLWDFGDGETSPLKTPVIPLMNQRILL
jgi:PKD repeat protein